MTEKKRVEQHPCYGEVHITTNPRARRIILRARAGFIEVTIPPYTTRKSLNDALVKHGDKLLAQCKANSPQTIGPDYRIEREGFAFGLRATDRGEFHMGYSGNEATLYYPASTTLGEPAMQEWLRRVRTTALHKIAQKHLPQRLAQLATQHGLAFSSVTLRDSHSRWGSCSSRRTISLSIYLQLLPQHLADYVMLHELCHTVEMNHGERFWKLLDSLTDGKAKQLRKELKGYKTDF